MEKQMSKAQAEAWSDAIEGDQYTEKDIELLGKAYEDWDELFQSFKIGGVEWNSPAYIGQIADGRGTVATRKIACLDEVRMTLDEYRGEVAFEHGLTTEPRATNQEQA